MLCLLSTSFQAVTKNCGTTHRYHLKILVHSILRRRLLLWRMALFIRLTKSFKVGNDCRQLHSHVGCNIQSVSIFTFCCRIPWTSSLAQLICGRWKQSEHCTFRQLRIFFKTAPEFKQRKLNESLFQASIRCSIFQTLVILHGHAIRFLWNTIWILDTGSVTGRRWEIFLKRLLQTVDWCRHTVSSWLDSNKKSLKESSHIAFFFYTPVPKFKFTLKRRNSVPCCDINDMLLPWNERFYR